MTLAEFFGLDKVGEQSVQEAHATVNDALTKAQPILDNLFNRLSAMCHGLLDRFTVDITIKLNPYARAETTDEGSDNSKS